MNSNKPESGMNNFIKMVKGTVLFLFIIFTSTNIIAAPSGGNVIHGGADINHSGGNTIIDQNTDKAIINWDKFNIGANENVRFNQKNSGSVVLNRVIGGARSEILGKLSANGNVFLLNSNGILIGNGASINVGSFMASTGAMSDKDFMNGSYRITGANNEIINRGEITVNNRGFAALLSKKVINEGLISAHLGRVDIAAGDSFTLNFYDNQLIGISIDKGTAGALIHNSDTGVISAQGGTVYISAKGLSSILHATVNNEGVIRADSLRADGGKVYISAIDGDVNNSGIINASSSQVGGLVKITGDNIIHSGSIVASGDVHGGIIFINSTESTELTDGSTAYVNSIIGNAGDIRILSNGITFFNKGAKLFSTSVHGNGGFVEVSAVNKINFDGNVDLSSTYKKGGQFLLDPRFVYIIDGTQTGNADTTYIDLAELIGLVNAGGYTIEASSDIYYEATNPLSGTRGSELVLKAGRDIVMTTPNITNLNSLSLIAGGNISITGGTITVDTLIAQLNGSGTFNSSDTALSAANLQLSASAGTGTFVINNLISATNLSTKDFKNDDSKIGGSLTIKSNSNINLVGVLVTDSIELNTTGSINNNSPSTEFSANEMNLTAGTGGISLINSQFNFMTLESGGNVDIINDNIGAVRFYKMSAATTGSSFKYTQNNGSLLTFKSIKSAALNHLEFSAEKMDIRNTAGSIEIPFLSVAHFTAFATYGGMKSGMVFNALNTILYDFRAAGDTTFTTEYGGPVTITTNGFYTNAIKNGILTVYVPVDVNVKVDSQNRSLVVNSGGTIDARLDGTLTPNGNRLTNLSLTAARDVFVDFYGTGNATAFLSVIAGNDAIITSTAGAATGKSIEINTLHADNDATVNFASYEPDTLNITGVAVKGKLMVDTKANASVTIVGDDAYNGILNVSFANKPLTSIDVLNNGEITISDTFPAVIKLKLNSLNGAIAFDTTTISAGEMDIRGRTLKNVTTFNVTDSTKTGVFKFSDSASFEYDGDFIDLSDNNNLTVKFTRTGGTTIRSASGEGFSMTGKNISLKSTAGLQLTFMDTANVDVLTIADGLGSFKLQAGSTKSKTVLNARILNITVTGSIYAVNETGDKTFDPVINADRASLTAGGNIGGGNPAGSLGSGDLNSNGDIDNYLTLNARLSALLTTRGSNENSIYVKPANYLKALRTYEFNIQPAQVAWMFDAGVARPVDTNMFAIFQAYKDQFFLPLNDLYNYRQTDFTAYDNLLQLGGDMITSDIIYPRYVTALYKINKKIEIK